LALPLTVSQIADGGDLKVQMFGLTTKFQKMQEATINNETPAIGNVLLAEAIKRLPKEKREEISKLFSEVIGRINSIEWRLIGTELETHSLYINGAGNCPTLWCEVVALEKLFRDDE